MTLLLLALLSCSKDRDPKTRAGDPNAETADTAHTTDSAEPVVDGCHAAPAAADRDRLVFASLPYDADAGQSDAWAVLSLSAEGALTDTGARLGIGRATAGEVVFTPDAAYGYAVLDDGTIGTIALADGEASVGETWDGGVYAVRAAMDPTGETLYVLDGNWPEHGGGLYRVPLDCETGAPGAAELVAAAKLPADLLLLERGDRVVLVGREVEGAETGEDLSLLSWPAGARVAGADAFGDDDALVSDAALTADDGLVLVADTSEFSGVPTRIAALRRDGDALEAAQVLEIEDPVALVASPWQDQVLVLSGYGDALLQVLVDADADEPLLDAGELDYVGGAPGLPGAAALVTRGDLAGLVLVSEVEGIRRVRLGPGASAEDLGTTSLGSGYDAIPGAVGVEP